MRRTFATVIAALLVTSGLWVFEAAPAHACSCEETTASSIDNSAGALIGTVVAIDDVADRFPEENAFVATVDVVIDLKENLPDQIFIDAYADDGGNCGTSWRIGQEIGVQLYDQGDGRLAGGGCGEFGRNLANQYQPPASVGQIGPGLSALERDRLPVDAPAGGGVVPASEAPQVAPPATEAPGGAAFGNAGAVTDPASSGLSTTVVIAIVAGLAAIALLVALTLRTEKRHIDRG